MNNSIKHRGPNNSGIKQFKNVTLGHVRLSIIDLSKKGNQPFSKLGCTIVFNGEIYNYIELKNNF
jgi:asparagine synthase (glutamine-hydrolysing)